MPKPNPNEKKTDYLQRCMSDDKMNSDFPDESQRYAVCNSYWQEDKKTAFNKYVSFAESYTDYPKQATENAKIALRYAEENGWGDCLEATGKTRANQLANGEAISRDTIARTLICGGENIKN